MKCGEGVHEGRGEFVPEVGEINVVDETDDEDRWEEEEKKRVRAVAVTAER